MKQRSKMLSLLLCVAFVITAFATVQPIKMVINEQGSTLKPGPPIPIAKSISSDNIAPEAIVHFDTETKEILVYGVDETDEFVEVLKTVLEDKPNTKTKRYILNDDAGNTLDLLVEEKRRDGNRELRFLEMSYNGGAPIILTRNYYKIEFKLDKETGEIAHLHQNIHVRAELKINTKYTAKDDRTHMIYRERGWDEFEQNITGLALFDMTTDNGSLEPSLLIDGYPDYDGDDLTNWEELRVYCTNPMNADTDGDGMPDGWEVQYGLDPLDPSDASGDIDGDGISNLAEYLGGTEPTVPDDPGELVDTDNDGLSDDIEIYYGTDPTNEDSDGDGLNDGDEVNWDVDTDGDGNINALDTDSDNDGMPDGWEYYNELDMVTDDASKDPDNDALTNLEEYQEGTNPQRSDTDFDGLNDDEEVDHGTDPTDGDSDGDSVFDGLEKDWNADSDRDGFINALDPDSDDDGLSDGEESELGTDPLRQDTDDDYVRDNIDPDPLDPDVDDDGLLDGEEATAGAFWIEVEDLVDTQMLRYDENAKKSLAVVPENSTQVIDTWLDIPNGTYKTYIRARSNIIVAENFTDISDWNVNESGENVTTLDDTWSLEGSGYALRINSTESPPATMPLNNTYGYVWRDFTELDIGNFSVSFDYMYPNVETMENFTIWSSHDGTEYDGLIVNQTLDWLYVNGVNASVQLTWLRWYHFDIGFETTGVGRTYGLYIDDELILTGMQLGSGGIATFGHLGDLSEACSRGEAYWDDMELVTDSFLQISIADGNSTTLIDSDTHPLTKDYRWFSTPAFDITNSSFRLQIDTYEYSQFYDSMFIDQILVVNEANFHTNLTNPLDEDTDGDGMTDGHESSVDAYWFEVEDFSPPHVQINNNKRASNGKEINNLNPLGMPVPTLLTTIDTPYNYTYGKYQVYVRARTLGIVPNANINLIVKYEHNTIGNLMGISYKYEWNLTKAFELTSNGSITIEVHSGAIPVSVDRILLIKDNYTPMATPPPGVKMKGGAPPTPGYSNHTFAPVGMWASWDEDEDWDEDGLGNYFESVMSTEMGLNVDPFKNDTDGDGQLDGQQFALLYSYGEYYRYINYVPRSITDPMDIDTDGDDLNDGKEVNEIGCTNPLDIDTDKDMLTDGWEVKHGWDPCDGDSDDDGLLDIIENGNLNMVIDNIPVKETDMLDDDTDNDGLVDGNEDSNLNGIQDEGETSSSAFDEDGNGVMDGIDSDGDLIYDGVEAGLAAPQGDDSHRSHPVWVRGLGKRSYSGMFESDKDPATTTNPLETDSDHDGLDDDVEDTNRNGKKDNDETRADDPDTDDDRLNDNEYSDYGTDPNERFTDGDALTDGEEVLDYCTDPTNWDTDGDELSDSDEVKVFGTKPNWDYHSLINNTALDLLVVVDYPTPALGTVSITSFTPGAVGYEDVHTHSGQIKGYVEIEATGNYAGSVIKWHYRDSDVGDIDQATLILYYWDDIEKEWSSADSSGVDADRNFAWAKTGHLSHWFLGSLLSDSDRDGLLDGAEIDLASVDDFSFDETVVFDEVEKGIVKDRTTYLELPVLPNSGRAPLFSWMQLTITGSKFSDYVRNKTLTTGDTNMMSLVIADMNKDDHEDIITAEYYGGHDAKGNPDPPCIDIYLQDSSVPGSFPTTPSISIDVRRLRDDLLHNETDNWWYYVKDMAVTDVNDDGWPDLVVLVRTAYFAEEIPDKVAIYWSVNGNFLNHHRRVLDLGDVWPIAIAVDDLNNDDKKDMAAAHGSGVSIFYQYEFAPGYFYTYPDRTITSSDSIYEIDTITDVAIADVYGNDGLKDLLFSINGADKGIVTVRQGADGALHPEDGVLNPIGGFITSFKVEDIDSDWDDDYVALVQNIDDSWKLLVTMNDDGATNWTNRYHVLLSEDDVADFEMGEFNDDHLMDLVTIDWKDNTVNMRYQTENWFPWPAYYPDLSIPLSGMVGRVDNLALGNFDGKKGLGSLDFIITDLRSTSKNAKIFTYREGTPSDLKLDLFDDGVFEWTWEPAKGNPQGAVTEDLSDTLNHYINILYDKDDGEVDGQLTVTVIIKSVTIGVLRVKEYSKQYVDGYDYITDHNNVDSDNDKLLDGRTISMDLDDYGIPTTDVDRYRKNLFELRNIVSWRTGDRLSFIGELNINTLPNDADSDDDGYEDGIEHVCQSNPRDPTSYPLTADVGISGNDGVTNCQEMLIGTDMYKKDLYGVVLDVTFNWEVTESFKDDFIEGMRLASNLLYDATEGYMIISKVSLYDGSDNFENADIYVMQGLANNTNDHNWPHISRKYYAPTEEDGVGAYFRKNCLYVGESANCAHIILPERFARDGVNPKDPNDPEFYRLVTRLMGTYVMSLYPENLDTNGNTINPGRQMRTLMASELNHSEFSTPHNYTVNPEGLNTSTMQRANHGKSCWEVIFDTFSIDKALIEFDFDENNVTDISFPTWYHARYGSPILDVGAFIIISDNT